MNPRLELGLTIAVTAAGAGYFLWRLFTATGDDQLVYIALLIVGAILAHRAIKDVLAKLRHEREPEAGG